MIEMKPDEMLKDLRRRIAGNWCIHTETLCLIFNGKILEKDETMTEIGLTNGATVHLVIKQLNKNQAEVAADLAAASKGFFAPPPQKSDITATPFGLGTLGGLAGTASVGMGSVNFMEMQQRMQRELLSNPESLRIVMENPWVRKLMNQPAEMHELMLANPAMKELIEANPEITQMMHNKELMSTVSDLAQNPAMLQELVRHEDRIALSSSEAIGPSLGVRLPEEDDDIIFMGSTEDERPQTFRGLSGFLRGSPWGRGRRPPPVSNLFNTAPMRSLLLQMTESPQIMQNMFSAPYIQTMMATLAQNPGLAEFVAAQNPGLEEEGVRAKIPDLIPHITAQMQNPAIQGLMTNPKALQAFMQVQRGLAALQTEAPKLVDKLSIPFDPKREREEEERKLRGEPEEEEEQPENIKEEGKGTPSPKKPKRDPKEELPLLLNQITNIVAAAVPGSVTNSQPPSEKYAAQAKQLSFLGFSNQVAVVEALELSGGNVNAAIERLVPKVKPAFDL